MNWMKVRFAPKADKLRTKMMRERDNWRNRQSFAPRVAGARSGANCASDPSPWWPPDVRRV